MAGLGSFITGAVGGYQQGADWKEGRQDRKRRREMEDERFKREKQDWGYQDEQRQWSREDRQYTVSERNRDLARRNEEEAFFKGLVDDPASMPPPAAPQTAPEDAPLKGPREIKAPSIASTAPDAPSMPPEPAPSTNEAQSGPPRRRTIKAPPPPAPGEGFFSQRAAQLGAAPQVRGLAALADVAQAALANPELRPEDRQKADQAVQAATIALEDAARAKTGPAPSDVPQSAGGSPEALYPGGLTPAEMTARQAPPQGTPMRARYPDLAIPYGSVPEDQPAQPTAPTSADAPINVPSSRDRVIRVQQTPDLMNRSVMAEPYYTPPEVRAGAARDIVRENRQIAADKLADSRQYSALQPAPMPTPAQPVAADKLPAVTPTTEEGTPQPSLEAATKTTPRTIKADGTAKPPTAAQEQRQQASFIEDYAKNQVPKIVKFYLGRGERDKADAYQKWADDTLVKEAMKDWAGAVHAASVGDDEGFINGIVGAYNAKGYFDDGYEIVREGSGIQRDAATGAVTGAQVTFRDRNTGKVFTQDFGAGEDLYRLGVDMLSPEQVFEYGWSRVQKKDDMKDAIASALMKQGLGKAVQADDVLKAMKSMADANLSFQTLPLDEQVMQAIELLRKFGGRIPDGIAVANPADVPVATRPKG